MAGDGNSGDGNAADELVVAEDGVNANAVDEDALVVLVEFEEMAVIACDHPDAPVSWVEVDEGADTGGDCKLANNASSCEPFISIDGVRCR